MASLIGPCLKIIVLQLADIVAAVALWFMQTYLTNVWNMRITKAAAIVNVFIGMSTVLPLLLTFLVDTIFGNYWMLLLSSLSYCIGLGFLTMSTPPVLSVATGTCSRYEPECIGDAQTILFYTSLALIAFGISGHHSSLWRFILDQIPSAAEEHVEGRPIEAFLCGWFLSVFAMILVMLISVFALPYIKPWSVRFGIPAICTLVATPLFWSGSRSYVYLEPLGSPLTRIFRVYTASTLKIHHHRPRDARQLYERDVDLDDLVSHTNHFRCLDKAAIILPSQTLEEQERNRWRICTVTEVEETKSTIRMVPVLLTFIVCGIVLAIGNTYFLEQANHMNRNVGRLKIPVPILLLLYSSSKSQAPMLYYKISSFLGKTERDRKYDAPIVIITGMILSILCCITAAKVENRRIHVIIKHGLLDKPDDTIPMSIFWLVPQFFLLGALNGLVINGAELFFRDQVPNSMRAYMILFTEVVLGAGIMASVLSVYLSDKDSKRGGRPGWFQHTLNRSRLDKYYWTLALLSTINLVLFAVVACCYSYKNAEIEDEEPEEDEETPEPHDDSSTATKKTYNSGSYSCRF